MDIVSSTISQRVLQFLEQGIIEGRFVPGQRLTEEGVAKLVGVSRSPVREALRKLEHAGLAVVVPRKGVFVRALDAKDAPELYTLQACVTGLMGRLAAERCRSEDVESLESVVRGMGVAAQNKDPRKFLDLFVDFTRTLARAAGNEWIEKALGSWEKSILRYGYFALSIPGYMQQALARYQAALDAIKAGDAARAEEVLRSSIDAGGRRIAEFLEGGGQVHTAERTKAGEQPGE